jgi:hypothetical protein
VRGPAIFSHSGKNDRTILICLWNFVSKCDRSKIMKILNPGIYQLNGKSPASEDHKKEAAAGPSFSEILENASAVKAGTAAAAAGRLDSFGQIETLNPSQKDALAKGEEILGLLGHLGKVLGASELSDSTAKSVAEAMSHRVDELKLLRDSLDGSDPLRDALNEIGTLSIVEQVKITRGDYG